MKRMFRMLMHPHPSGLVLHFRYIARIDLVIGQCRDTLQALTFRFGNSAVFNLLHGPGYDPAGFFIRFLHTPSFRGRCYAG